VCVCVCVCVCTCTYIRIVSYSAGLCVSVCLKRDSARQSVCCTSRCCGISKETYLCQKRPICTKGTYKRGQCVSNETYTRECARSTTAAPCTHTATYCNTLQHTAKHIHTLRDTLQQRPAARGLQLSLDAPDAVVHQKRPTCVKRDLFVQKEHTKEANVCQMLQMLRQPHGLHRSSLTHVGQFGRMQIFFDDYKSLLTHTGLFCTFQHTSASGVAAQLQLQMLRYVETSKRDLYASKETCSRQKRSACVQRDQHVSNVYT